MPSDSDLSRTDTFHLSPRNLHLIALMTAALLGLAIVAISSGAASDTPGDGAKAIFVLGSLGLLLWGAYWLRRRRPAMLRVGPDGIALPVGWTQPLAWEDIYRIRLRPLRRLTGAEHWLIISPAPGVLPAHRLAGPRRLEAWYAHKAGIRIPLHTLDAPPETVIASIERFRPVSRAESS